MRDIDVPLVVAGFVFVLIIVIAIYFMVRENQKWENFKQTHHCKVIGKVSGSTSFGVGTNGNMTTIVTPGKTGWSCDDGVTYWR